MCSANRNPAADRHLYVLFSFVRVHVNVRSRHLQRVLARVVVPPRVSDRCVRVSVRALMSAC
jgi:hypothetical protein